jgi:hypothetical protein
MTPRDIAADPQPPTGQLWHRAAGGVLIAASLGIVALTGCGGASTSTSASSSTDAATKTANPCRTRAARLTGTKPARIIPGDTSPYPGAVIGPVRNAWAARVGDRATTVYAGGQGYGDPDRGKFLITREGSSPKTNSVYVSQAGALKITKAPVGCRVIGWAQKRGNLQFTSTNGVTGTLHLKDDSVTLDG